MKLGLLADIHEDAEGLAAALDLLRWEAVDGIVVLGDVLDTGRHIAETVALLKEAGAIGVWGNHDLGLCHEPEEHVRARYAGPVLEYLQTLRPRLELRDCLFSHGLPGWDPTDPTEYYLGAGPETTEGRTAGFLASDSPLIIMGHFHRWLAATPQGEVSWGGGRPLLLDARRRYLVAVAAVCDGWCATLDTSAGRLTPWRVRGSARCLPGIG